MRKDTKKKNKNKNIIVAAIILLLLVAITIGYAGLSTTLNINGTTSISKVEWDIHFENLEETAGSVTAFKPAAIVGDKKTVVNYGVNFVNPGEYYEFKVDVVNKGTLDAVITDVIKAGLDGENSKYLNYTVTYLNGSTIADGQELKAGDKATYVVRVEFDDSSSNNLPEEGIPSLELTFAVTYSQK